MGHHARKRAIRHAEANDLISRNVATLVDTSKGQPGRLSKSLTLDQAVAVITAARTLPVLELHSVGVFVLISEHARRSAKTAPLS